MRSVKAWTLAAMAGAATLAGCMKAGDGVGLTDRGTMSMVDPCKVNPSAAGCPVVVDSCKTNPALKGCPVAVDSCKSNPLLAGCPAVTDSCKLVPAPTGCSVVVDSCKLNPSLPGCPVVGPDCSKSPKPVGCLDKAFFTANVAPIFKENCEVCHKPNGQAWSITHLSLETATGWDSLVNVPSKEMLAPKHPDMLRVKPGDPDSSYLYWKITKATPGEGSRMPLGAAPLTADQIMAIRTWIQGK